MKDRARTKLIDPESPEVNNFVNAASERQSVVIKSSKDADKNASKNANTIISAKSDADNSKNTENQVDSEESEKLNKPDHSEDIKEVDAATKKEKSEEKQALIAEYKAIFDHSPKGKVSKAKPYSLRMNAYQNALMDFICKIEDISKVSLINECMFNKTNIPELLKKAKKKVDKM